MNRREHEVPATLPRLISMKEAASYLGVSFWTVREWVLGGHLPSVRLPPLRRREGEAQRECLRRVLIDREQIDAFVESRTRGGRQ